MMKRKHDADRNAAEVHASERTKSCLETKSWRHFAKMSRYAMKNLMRHARTKSASPKTSARN